MVALVVVRGFLVPGDFGTYGHFRAGALDDNRLHPISFAGAPACHECHSDAAAAIAKGRHARVQCEACHGPLAAHAEDPLSHEGHKPDPTLVCARCHTANVAKPAGFPQVDLAEHAGDLACHDCHVSHDPGLE